MWIKGFLVLILLLIVVFQVLFVVSFGGYLGLGGQKQLFDLYHSFGVDISSYTLWVLAFARTKLAFLLPLISLNLGFWAIYKKTGMLIISVLLLLGMITLALYAGVYLPSYWVVTMAAD